MDLVHRDRLHIEAIHHTDPFSSSALDDYRSAYDRLTQAGKTVKAVLLCNPQNPLGRCYSRETLLAFGKFCEERNLHLVSDEIYATSIYVNDGMFRRRRLRLMPSEADDADYKDALPFTSVLAIDFAKELNCKFDSSRIHGESLSVCLITQSHGSFSDIRDEQGVSRVSLAMASRLTCSFCANGLRVSCLISQHNPELLKTMGLLGFFMKGARPAKIGAQWRSLVPRGLHLVLYLGEPRRIPRLPQ